ncbi:MAG: 2Fe-2S iron-sulfur cluster-binding protein [Pseudomonadota bacterium]
MFHELTVRDVRAETPDAVAVSFDVPDGLKDAFRFEPGQYLTLRHDVDGADLRRSYSIASLPVDPLTVGIKQVENGAFSTFAQTLTKGDCVKVMSPQGRFLWTGETRIVLIAAGSGVTPMIAIAGAALAAGAEVTLVLGNRSIDTIMFRDTLNALKDRHIGRFTLIHVLSREPQDVDILNGRVSGDRVLKLANAGAVNLGSADGVFLCGPGGMIDDVSDALRKMGVAEDKIHFERFTQGDEAPRMPKSQAATEAADEGVAIDVMLDGRTRSFGFDSTDDSIVDAAARQGLELPFSCKGGMCCTCRCKVTEGSAEMAVNYSLEPWELQAGFTLACQARPTSRRLTLDFDAA